MTNADLQFTNHGSIVLMNGLTDAGENWIADNVIEGDVPTWCGQTVIEPRYVQDIIDGAELDGMLVAVN